jgi:hypothetical protein
MKFRIDLIEYLIHIYHQGFLKIGKHGYKLIACTRGSFALIFTLDLDIAGTESIDFLEF